MRRMHETNRLGEPPSTTGIEEWQNRVEVLLILRPNLLRLEEQDDFWLRVGDSVLRSRDCPWLRKSNARVPPANPGVTVPRFSKDVQPPVAARRVACPGLVMRRTCGAGHGLRETVANHEELQLRERSTQDLELILRYSDLQVLVLARLVPDEEIDGPTGADVPDHVHVCEPPRRLSGMPGFPQGQVGHELRHGAWLAAGQIQRRQRNSASWMTVDTRMRPLETPSVQNPRWNSPPKFCP